MCFRSLSVWKHHSVWEYLKCQYLDLVLFFYCLDYLYFFIVLPVNGINCWILWKRGELLLFLGNLSKKTLLFTKKFIEVRIKGRYSSFIHKIGLNTFKIISQFHKKLISFTSFMDLLYWSKTFSWQICIDNVTVFRLNIRKMRREVKNRETILLKNDDFIFMLEPSSNAH